MDKLTISKKIQKLASQELKKNISFDSLNASLVLDLGAESLDIVELLMAIEKEFSVEFPDSINSKMNSLQDIINNTISLLENSTKE